MLDILLLPQPNESICSPAALEAVERDDVTSVKKLLLRSDFITCAPNFLYAAVECGSVNSLNYMISQVDVKNEFGENLLKSAVQIRPNDMDNAGLVVSCIIEHLTSENLKNVIDRIAPCSHQKNMKHVHEHFEILRQHELLTQVVNDTPANHMARKKNVVKFSWVRPSHPIDQQSVVKQFAHAPDGIYPQPIGMLQRWFYTNVQWFEVCRTPHKCIRLRSCTP